MFYTNETTDISPQSALSTEQEYLYLRILEDNRDVRRNSTIFFWGVKDCTDS